MSDIFAEVTLNKDDEVMTCKELAAYLKVSPGLIYDLTKKGEIPHIKIGAELRFVKAQVLKSVFGN